MIRKVLFGLLFSLSISASAQFRDADAPMDYTKWSIHDGKFFDDGKWVFLKTAKPLINYADANSVNSLIKKLDILKEKHYNAVEMNCYWHHFDSNGDGLIDVSLLPLRRMVEAVYARGMYPCLSVETYAVGGGNIPDPFWDRNPDAYAIDAKGNKVNDTEYGFGTKVVSIYHEGYRNAVHRYIRSLVRGIDARKILYFETTVEPQYMGNTAICYSENARREYNKWREENGITDPQSAMPESFPMPASFIRNDTWNKFRAQFLARWVNEDAEAFRLAAGEDAYIAVDYLDANESVQYLRDGNPLEFLRALTCANIIQVNWTWNLETKSINQKAYDRVWKVRNETGRDWVIAEHMTLNGDNFTNIGLGNRRILLDNTLKQGTRFSWEFTNVNNNSNDGFSLYYDDFTPKPTIATVDDDWDYWMERLLYWEGQSSVLRVPLAPSGPSTVYSLSGHVLPEAPAQPGIYVSKGKKVFRK